MLSTSSVRAFRNVGMLIVGYLLLGAASMMLAVAPGYACPVFPPAGLAMAGVLRLGRSALPGVWLGSALLNLGHSWLSGKPDITALAIACLIGSGAMLQAGIGSWLVKRVLGRAVETLQDEKDVLRFLLLGGVLSTLVSATLCVVGLCALGVIERPEFLFAWWNWYVGDSVGVIAFTPLTLCFLSRPDGLWRERRRRIVVPMLLTIGLLVLAFYGVAQFERQSQQTQLQADGQAIAKRITDRLVTHREVLSSLRNFIEVTPDFSFQQFELFTRITLQGQPDTYALSFNDRVTLAERPAYEQMMRGLSLSGAYQITEFDSQGRLVRAAERPDYVAVRYIVPLARNRLVLGLDISSEPIRQDALRRATASLEMAVTAPIQLVQDEKKRVGVLELLPVRDTARPRPDGADARPRGFAVAVVKVDEMIEIATRERVPPGLAFQVIDTHAREGEGVLYRSPELVAGQVISDRAMGWKSVLRMGDRDWELSVYPTVGYFQQKRPGIVWAVGGVGMLFTLLMQLLMLGMTGRAELLQRKSEALRASEDRYQRLFNDSPLPMWQYEAGTLRFLTVNDKALAHYGWTREAFLGMTLADIRHPDEPPAAGTDPALPGELLPNCRHVRCDGSVIDVIVSASRLPCAGGDTHVQVIQDVSQQVRLIADRESAEQASLAKSRFLATVSHELRTPMNGILGIAQILLRPGLSESARQEHAQLILRSGQVLLGLLNDILDFSRVEAGKLELHRAPVEPAALLQDVLELFSESASRKGLALGVRWEGAFRQAFLADRQRLLQMLSNLVGNAIKFTDSGGIHIEARQADAADGQTMLEFAVSDSGVGIPEDKQNLIFKPFSQADSSSTRQYGGAGLGLSIVSSLAESMGGSVGFHSVSAEGSCFWFRIRAEALAAAELQAVVPTMAFPAAALKMGGQVLVVEDNPTNRLVAQAMLRSLGVRVSCASDGLQCVQMLGDGRAPDLILMDVHMPAMDGLATTRWIRRREAELSLPHVPVVALTADVFDDNRLACLDAGMDDFIVKPLMVEPLAAMLRRWLPHPNAADAAPAAPVDIPRLDAQVDALAVLLLQSDFDALECFRAVHELLIGTPLADDFAEVGRLIGEMRFAPAHALLLQVRARIQELAA